jgi:hypothetical protein
MSSAQSSPTNLNPSGVIDYPVFKEMFESAYNAWSTRNAIPDHVRDIVESYEITAAQFEELTLSKENQRYIALYDGKIKFYELPTSPHGSIIGSINLAVANQINGATRIGTFIESGDDGTLFFEDY